MTDTTDLEALASTLEGRAQMATALAKASAAEASTVLDLLNAEEVNMLVAKLKLYAERAGDAKLRSAAGNVATSIDAHRDMVQGLLLSAQLAAGGTAVPQS